MADDGTNATRRGPRLMPGWPEFDRAEYERRVARLQQHLAPLNVEGVLIADEPNYRYFTGHYTESWLNRSRAVACWIPLDGEPVPIVCETDEQWARATSWCEAIEVYSGPVLGPAILGAPEVGFEPALVEVLAEVLVRRAGRNARLGLPCGSRSRVQLPLGVVLALRDRVPGLEWVDAADALFTTRAVKSKAEVEQLREAVSVLDRAMPELISSVQVGMSERQIAHRVRAAILAAGADQLGYTNVVADLTSPLFSGPSARAIEAGKPFYVDSGAVVGGYWSDYCRLGVVGDPVPEAAAAYELLVEALGAGAASIEPGVTAGEVASAMSNVLSGRRDNMSIGRMGHGIGLEMPEPPSLHIDDRTVLEAGMVLAVEPNLLLDGIGTVIVEDMFVVTREGSENLSTAPTPRKLSTSG